MCFHAACIGSFYLGESGRNRTRQEKAHRAYPTFSQDLQEKTFDFRISTTDRQTTKPSIYIDQKLFSLLGRPIPMSYRTVMHFNLI